MFLLDLSRVVKRLALRTRGALFYLWIRGALGT